MRTSEERRSNFLLAEIANRRCSQRPFPPQTLRLYAVLPRDLCFPETMMFVSKKEKKKIMRNIFFVVPLSHSETTCKNQLPL